MESIAEGEGPPAVIRQYFVNAKGFSAGDRARARWVRAKAVLLLKRIYTYV